MKNLPIKNSPKKMTRQQYAAFMIYYAMGGERSLEKLHQQITKESPVLGVRPVVLRTLKSWSGKFDWQKEIKELDEKANKQMLEDAIGEARKARIDMMKIFRVVVQKFAIQLRDNPNKEITSQDVANFWKMSMIEMGLPTERTDLTTGGSKVNGFIYVKPEGGNQASHQTDDQAGPGVEETP